MLDRDTVVFGRTLAESDLDGIEFHFESQVYE